VIVTLDALYSMLIAILLRDLRSRIRAAAGFCFGTVGYAAGLPLPGQAIDISSD
jgi:hypothetical protein